MPFRPSVLRQIDAARRRFGDDSGLTYDETSVHANSTHRTWQFKRKGSLRFARYCNVGGKGAATLRSMLVRKLASLVHELSPEHFAGVAWAPVKPLWDFLHKQNLVSIYVWKVFAQAFPEEQCLKQLKFNAHMFLPAGTWATSLNAVNSPGFRFITLLEIANVKVGRLDLLNLPELANLGALSIGPDVAVLDSDGGDRSGLDEAILRSWVRQSEFGMFPCLRYLCLRDQPGLSITYLKWAAQILSLARFDVEGHRDFASLTRETIELLGWVSLDASDDSSDKEGLVKSAAPADGVPAVFASHAAAQMSILGARLIEGIETLPRLHLEVLGPDMRPHHQRRGQKPRFRFLREVTPLEQDPLLSDRHDRSTWQVQTGNKKRSADGTASGKQLKARKVQQSVDTLAAFGM